MRPSYFYAADFSTDNMFGGRMVYNLRKFAPHLVSFCIFATLAIRDAFHQTITTLTFLSGVLLLIGLSNLWRESRQNAASAKIKPTSLPRSLPTGLICSDEGMTYVDSSSKTRQLAWEDVLEVTWNEPDYGYLGGEPYWLISGKRGGLVVEDAWHAGKEDPFPLWLAKELPGFDAGVVDKARMDGYFNTDSLETLLCWTRSDESHSKSVAT